MHPTKLIGICVAPVKTICRSILKVPWNWQKKLISYEGTRLAVEMWSLLKFSRSKFSRISIWCTELLPAFYSIFLDRKISKDSKFRYKRTECFLFDLLMVRCLHSLAVFDFSRKIASGKFQKITPSHDRVLSSEKKLFFSSPWHFWDNEIKETSNLSHFN